MNRRQLITRAAALAATSAIPVGAIAAIPASAPVRSLDIRMLPERWAYIFQRKLSDGGIEMLFDFGTQAEIEASNLSLGPDYYLAYAAPADLVEIQPDQSWKLKRNPSDVQIPNPWWLQPEVIGPAT
jgi:hypothetical protein